MKKSPGKWLRVALNLADGKWSAKVTQARCKFAVVGHGWDPDCEKTREQISALEKTSTKATIDLLDGKQRPVAMGELQYKRTDFRATQYVERAAYSAARAAQRVKRSA